MSRTSSHAIVVGASIAGLLAARVLPRYFDRVTLVERDALPDLPVSRIGVPQANHNHVLLLRGRQIMEELFPGLQAAVLGDGGLLVDMANELAWLTPWGWGVRFASPLVMLACSRALLDWRLRTMLAASGDVTLSTGTHVRGLVMDGRRVRGIRTEAGDIEADLVIDASGRGSRAPQWLQEGGFMTPPESCVSAFLGYASRFYRPGDDGARWWKGLYLQAAPPDHPRVGVILPIEGGLWHVTLGGGDRQFPPGDDRGFLDFARSLRSAALHDAICGAEPLSPIYVTRSTENRRRHFETIAMPEGFVAMGDSVCAFNPVYGQGMTTAALGARTLDACLGSTLRRTGAPDGNGLPAAFHDALTKINDRAWMLATGEDLRYRSTEGGRRSIATRFMHRYLDAIGATTTTDQAVRLQLLRTFHMVAGPEALFSPAIWWRMVRRRSTRRARAEDAHGGVAEEIAPWIGHERPRQDPDPQRTSGPVA